MAGLKAWLRRSPQPTRIRVRTEDDEVRIIELSADARNRWKAAEEAVLASRATTVECLDKNEAILRAQRLEVEPTAGDDDGGAASYAIERRNEERLLGKERRDMGALLNRYGDRLNEAFERGAAAAGVSQENLVNLVETLTSHLSLAITNLHNVSVNLAQMVQTQADSAGPDNTDLLSKVLGVAAAKSMGAAPDNAKGKKP